MNKNYIQPLVTIHELEIGAIWFNWDDEDKTSVSR